MRPFAVGHRRKPKTGGVSQDGVGDWNAASACGRAWQDTLVAIAGDNDRACQGPRQRQGPSPRYARAPVAGPDRGRGGRARSGRLQGRPRTARAGRGRTSRAAGTGPARRSISAQHRAGAQAHRRICCVGGPAGAPVAGRRRHCAGRHDRRRPKRSRRFSQGAGADFRGRRAHAAAAGAGACHRRTAERRRAALGGGHHRQRARADRRRQPRHGRPCHPIGSRSGSPKACSFPAGCRARRSRPTASFCGAAEGAARGNPGAARHSARCRIDQRRGPEAGAEPAHPAGCRRDGHGAGGSLRASGGPGSASLAPIPAEGRRGGRSAAARGSRTHRQRRAATTARLDEGASTQSRAWAGRRPTSATSPCPQ